MQEEKLQKQYHKNESKLYECFSWGKMKILYYKVNNGKQTRWFIFLINILFCYQNDAKFNQNNCYKNEND